MQEEHDPSPECVSEIGSPLSFRSLEAGPGIPDLLGRLALDDPFLDVPVANLRLHLRTFNALKAIGVEVVRDLLRYDEDLLALEPSIGKVTIREIQGCLLARLGVGPTDATALDAGPSLAIKEPEATLPEPGALPLVRPFVPVRVSRQYLQDAPDIQAILQRLPEDDQALSIAIRALRLSVRSSNVLRRLGVFKIADLRAYSDRELLELPAFGHKCLAEVKSAALGIVELAQLRPKAAPLEQGQPNPATQAIRRHLLADDETGFADALEASLMCWVEPGESLLAEIHNIVAHLVQPTREGVPPERVERNRRLILERYGVAGPVRTLEELGQEIGTTRERARQIVDQSMKRCVGKLFYDLDKPSHLGRLLEALRPGSTPRLRSEGDGLDGLLGPTMTLFDAGRFFEDLLGIRLMEQVREEYSRSRFGLLESQEHELMRDLRAAAVEIIEATGAVHVDTMLGTFYTRIAGKLTPEHVHSILVEDRRLQALPGQPGWIWFAPPRMSRFQVEAEKMLLTAGGRLDLYDLQAKYRGIRSRRDAHRLSDAQLAVLPLEVAKAVMNATGFARQVQYNDYVYTGPRTLKEVLTPVEWALVRSIEELGGAGGSFEIARHARDQHGLLLLTAIMGLHNAGVVHRIDFGAFVVFGRPVAPYMDRLREVARTSRFARSLSDPLGLRVGVTDNYLRRNCNVSLPSSVGEALLERGVEQIVEENTGLSLLPRKSGDFYYLLGGTPIMRALGAKVGQTLVLVLDASEDTVRAVASLDGPDDARYDAFQVDAGPPAAHTGEPSEPA